MTIPDAPLTARRLAGYRVLRSLARDAAAELLLGFRDPDGETADDDERREPAMAALAMTVALKVVPATPQRWDAVLGVLEALERARGEHVVDLLDLDADDDAICLVFERLPNGSLAEILALRDHLDAGEVVTVVAPVAEAVRRMHVAGIAHGAVGTRTVMFRADGAPVLIGFGAASLFPPGSPEVLLERVDGVGADRRALRELACLLLSRVVGPRARAARGLVEELEACPEDLVLDVLRGRLFEIAAAIPVRFFVDDVASQAVATRLVPLSAPLGTELHGADDARGIFSRIVPDAWAQRVLDAVDGSPAAPVLAAGARRWRNWSPARRRGALGAVAAAVALATALAVVPNAPRDAASAAQTPRPSASASGSPAGSATASGEMGTEDAVAADDPLAAAVALVEVRDRCLRSLSQLCLDRVDQQDSGALRDDRETIRAAQQGGELPGPLVGDGSELAPELVERLGDTALVRLAVAASATEPSSPSATTRLQREPASLLLVKGEAGWRIRDVVAAPVDPN